MGRDTDERKNGHALTTIVLRANADGHEVYDVERKTVRVWRQLSAHRFQITERRPTDSDMWLLSKIAATIDSEVFDGPG